MECLPRARRSPGRSVTPTAGASARTGHRRQASSTGVLDNVRVYSRALSANEIQTDLESRIQPDRTPPTFASSAPADGTTGVSVGATITGKFSEPLRSWRHRHRARPSCSRTRRVTRCRRRSATTPRAWVASLKPQSALKYGATYRAVFPAGGAKDLAGTGSRPTLTPRSPPRPQRRRCSWSARAPTPSGIPGRDPAKRGLDAFTTLDATLLSRRCWPTSTWCYSATRACEGQRRP